MKILSSNNNNAGLAAAILTLVIVMLSCQASPAEPTPGFVDGPDCNELQHGALSYADLLLSTEHKEITVHVELADESSERTQGLMCRETVSPGTGMLFIYDSDRNDGFWMYNTYLPIDILYLDQSGSVVAMISMSPCIRGRDGDEQWRVRCAAEAASYVPGAAWRNSLELPGGWLAEQGLGDPIITNMTVSWSTAGR
ncbi:MAG: DUF192 domain-containing protein [Chloroflexi bacterium]|nr:DUF192 domain-containing protein [Chloroflexota bacterium]